MLESFVQVVSNYIFIYPVVMSLIWILGGFFYWLKHENKLKKKFAHIIWPDVTILVVGAVTANPIPVDTRNFISKCQTAEFMSIIGLIKRSQSFFGNIFTVSGCTTLYSSEVLNIIGGFSKFTATEDIDVTWKIMKSHYKTFFQPQAVVEIQIPLTFKDYWEQRKRWALGGWHFLRKNTYVLLHWNLRHLWHLVLDFIFAYIWGVSFSLYTVFAFIILTFGFQTHIKFALFPSELCILSVSLNYIQTSLAISINAVYDKRVWKSFLWMPWYPIFFFMISAVLVTWTSWKGLFGGLKNSGKWKSPHRNGKENA